MKLRMGEKPAEDAFTSVNDIRNGLVLNLLLHHALREQEVAFLQTPNFALGIDDTPTSRDARAESAQDIRLTWQYFRKPHATMLAIVLQNTSMYVNPSTDPACRPHPAIFDALYGTVALRCQRQGGLGSV
ncbi:hypothetical protein BV22DRAFT_233964 [Leucogyrophana mollusca]|uniref:Uncharacterized protein n=1 Tax=Leucogyrophana mollusca TaxID=85980 RepID=A0ACB8BQ00_9AGAM|nr:hypothetical protein BV22DRAFT_233964 [Leucogyrophana mollusca]